MKDGNEILISVKLSQGFLAVTSDKGGHMRFKVGDIITGKPNNRYAYTTDRATMEVVELSSKLNHCDMRVRILQNLDHPGDHGTYDVLSDRFILMRDVCPLCRRRLPEEPIVINGETVLFDGAGIKVGCTLVDKETVLKIADRLRDK